MFKITLLNMNRNMTMTVNMTDREPNMNMKIEREHEHEHEHGPGPGSGPGPGHKHGFCLPLYTTKARFDSPSKNMNSCEFLKNREYPCELEVKFKNILGDLSGALKLFSEE